jgi:hypothetical protein
MAAVDQKTAPVGQDKEKRDPSLARKGYKKANAFSRVAKNGRVHVTPHLFRKRDETQEQFLVRMSSPNVGYLGPDKPKGHWAPDNRVYHMGESSKGCPYCEGRLPSPGINRSPNKEGGGAQRLKVTKIGPPVRVPNGWRLYLYFSSESEKFLDNLKPNAVQFLVKPPIVEKVVTSRSPSSKPPQVKEVKPSTKPNPESKIDEVKQSAPVDKLEQVKLKDPEPTDKK